MELNNYSSLQQKFKLGPIFEQFEKDIGKKVAVYIYERPVDLRLAHFYNLNYCVIIIGYLAPNIGYSAPNTVVTTEIKLGENTVTIAEPTDKINCIPVRLGEHEICYYYPGMDILHIPIICSYDPDNFQLIFIADCLTQSKAHRLPYELAPLTSTNFAKYKVADIHMAHKDRIDKENSRHMSIIRQRTQDIKYYQAQIDKAKSEMVNVPQMPQEEYREVLAQSRKELATIKRLTKTCLKSVELVDGILVCKTKPLYKLYKDNWYEMGKYTITVTNCDTYICRLNKRNHKYSDGPFSEGGNKTCYGNIESKMKKLRQKGDHVGIVLTAVEFLGTTQRPEGTNIQEWGV